MAITLKQLWGHTERPWGYEIRADFTDGTKVYNEVMHWKAQPSQSVIDAQVAALLARLTAEANPPTRTIRAQDGVNITVLQSDCAEAADFAITITNPQNTALDTVRTRLQPYLQKLLPIYRALPPEKQAELRAHCSVLNRVLEMLGE